MFVQVPVVEGMEAGYSVDEVMAQGSDSVHAQLEELPFLALEDEVGAQFVVHLSQGVEVVLDLVVHFKHVWVGFCILWPCELWFHSHTMVNIRGVVDCLLDASFLFFYF